VRVKRGRQVHHRAVALAIVSLLSACGANGNKLAKTAGADSPSSSEATITTTGEEVTGTSAPVATAGTLPADFHAINGPIVPLAFNDDVKRLQTRLNELKFWVGEPDGYFGDTTRAQVWAYQKVVLGLKGDAVSGIVSPEMWEQMAAPPVIEDPRPDATATHVNVFLTQQIATVFTNGQLALVTHISSGSGEEWCAIPRNTPEWPGATTTTNAAGRKQRVCGKAVTPGGVFEVYRRFRGKEEIPLGTVFDPVYFNAGIAIHGFEFVPQFPASHGCIRVPLSVGTAILNVTKPGDQVFVFDGKEEPETYGSQRPPYDEADPNDTQFTKAVPKPKK
jgi:peptidoglycan hydrolase-like protein with peptidoglycan-binding domain